MIRVTLLDGNPCVVNAEQIETIESRPDTILSLVSGRKLLIRDSPADVVDHVIEYRRAIQAGPKLDGRVAQFPRIAERP